MTSFMRNISLHYCMVLQTHFYGLPKLLYEMNKEVIIFLSIFSLFYLKYSLYSDKFFLVLNSITIKKLI